MPSPRRILGCTCQYCGKHKTTDPVVPPHKFLHNDVKTDLDMDDKAYPISKSLEPVAPELAAALMSPVGAAGQ